MHRKIFSIQKIFHFQMNGKWGHTSNESFVLFYGSEFKHKIN